MNPAISVIVPVYNTEKYLRRCIDSILSQTLSQTFTDFELLLINDGSTDSSGEICDQYAAKDERVRVFHKENGGVSSARNVGLDEARGEWIAFVDSDDWVEFGYLLAFWQADCSADLLVGTAIIRKQDFPDRYCMLTPVGLLTDIKSFLSFTLGTCLMNVPWGKWFRRKLINTLRFNSSLYVGEDTFFLLHYLQKVQSITILPFSYTNRTNYVFIEKSVPFNIKYQMSVDIAVRTLTMTMALYRTLSIESLCFEKFVSGVYYDLCHDDLSLHFELWYGNSQIRTICLQRSRKEGVVKYWKTKLIFTPWFYRIYFRWIYPCFVESKV